MTSRRRATRFTSVIIGTSMLLTACGGNDSAEVPQAAPEKPAGDVEIVTVTQYNDGTVLGPDDEVQGEDEPEAVDTADTEEEHADTGADGDDAADDDTQDQESSDLAPGETEYIGTVEKQTTEEILKGAPDPNPSSSKPSDRYYVLVLDEPAEVTGNKGGNMNYSKVNEILALGDNSYFDTSERWEPYVGKRIRLIVNEGDLNYASDTSLPLGGLRLSENHGRVEEL